ncbi:hypothetical protein ACFQVC_09440 [Streptomyces monticola]|uniref:Uncharacterized protein n=1 Tax=Streptomyces monticola TaxID=2666263 RepID=A0ABW2JGL9_9ACTN
MEHQELTEQECRDLLATATAGRLAINHHRLPHLEPVGLIHPEGDPVALLPESSTIARALPAVISPRRLVVLQADDLSSDLPYVHTVVAVARPRWVVSLEGIRACRRAARARGLQLDLDNAFLTLTRPTLMGHQVQLRQQTQQPQQAALEPVRPVRQAPHEQVRAAAAPRARA